MRDRDDIVGAFFFSVLNQPLSVRNNVTGEIAGPGLGQRSRRIKMQLEARVTIQRDLRGQMDALNEIQRVYVRGKDGEADVAVFIRIVCELRSKEVRSFDPDLLTGTR
jgi:hypothetical protein